jgi:ABC-2 type transport system ATP-binding protein
MIEVRGLTKRYGRVTAIDGLSFDVLPGRVTGFLGPNGSGKSTTMRLVVGLDIPTSGSVAVAGRPYRELGRPLTEVGALLDAGALHPGRRARDHLRWLAVTNGISRRRADEVLALVGLESAARRRASTLSLGMRQRLGIAVALLGNPGVLLFDEPINGLDPEGIVWVRRLMRSLAAEGRTVFVSSHLMSEMALTADHLVVVGRGKLVADAALTDFVEQASLRASRVVTPEPERLASALDGAGATVSAGPDGLLEVTGLTTARIGELALAASVVLHELTPVRASLEEAYMELTADSVEYRVADPAAGARS